MYPHNTKMHPIKLTFAITLALASLISNPVSVRTETIQISSKPPEAPDTGTPEGNPTPGTTRPEANCQNTNKPLTALVANNGSDYTLSKHPSFWFYIPYAPKHISYAEFVLLDGKESRTIYRTAVKLTEKPGIIKITIPAKPQYSLKLNDNYRWYFLLNCTGQTDEPDLVVDGWVRRRLRNFQLKDQIEVVKPTEYIPYSKKQIFYDTITNLAEQHFANPQNRKLNEAWANLLESLGYASVAQEPFVASELLPPKD